MVCYFRVWSRMCFVIPLTGDLLRAQYKTELQGRLFNITRKAFFFCHFYVPFKGAIPLKQQERLIIKLARPRGNQSALLIANVEKIADCVKTLYLWRLGKTRLREDSAGNGFIIFLDL